eukprot:Phypoly_transcript_12359.p1 GENE.Phypoly_transcript_12359~~Phypoly_transcript_12359.p1  ORF type:complete len:293 (+),score=54.24 Phypoly_transcript_12359:193-1071(+)
MTTINPTRVVLPVEPRDDDGYLIDPDSIRLDVKGPEEVDANIESKKGGAAGELVVVFTTTKSGEYHVSLTHRGKHIKFSPMVVKVEPKKDASAPPPPVQLPKISKTQVKFMVDGVDGTGKPIPPREKVVVECEGPEKVEPSCTRVEGGKILVSFEAHIRRGNFKVSLLHNGSHIHRSPFEISVSPSDEEQVHEYDYEPLPSLPAASRAIEFSVKAKTKDLLRVDARDCVGEVILGEDRKSDVTITNSGGDDLLVSFQAFKPGKHKISVRKGGVDIIGSPFKVEVPVEAIYGH